MKWKHNFRQVDASEALSEYAQEQFEKIGRLLLKDSQWQIFYRKGKFEYEIEVSVKNPDSHFKAAAKGENLYIAVDLIAEKLSKQFSRRKDRLQDHSKRDRTKEARLERLNERLEYNNTPFFQKKSG
jgi:putative sigma-54 modulation protein